MFMHGEKSSRVVHYAPYVCVATLQRGRSPTGLHIWVSCFYTGNGPQYKLRTQTQEATGVSFISE